MQSNIKEKQYIDKKERIKPIDVTKIAWAIGEKYDLSEDAIKSIANTIWAIVYPEKELWKQCPKKPKSWK